MKIEQIKLVGESKDSINFVNGWSTNLFANKIVFNIAIYAIPGTKFKITKNTNTKELIIDETGIFSMNFENYPLTELYLSRTSYNNLIGKHFIVIDILYEEKGLN